MHIDPANLNDPGLVAAVATGHARLSFSQLGEDAVLWHLFGGKRDGFYVDVGCHHPHRFSNTALLSTFLNWSGLNIDVDDDLIAAFQTARPRDINVCAAVGRDRGKAEVTLFWEPAVNSLDPLTVEAFKHHFKPKAVRDVDVFPLSELLHSHLAAGQQIDFMNIDVEGLDFAVLQSSDWEAYKPQVVAVEAHGFNLANAAADETFQFLTGKGYRLHSHVVVTSIYVLG